ncbi:Alpha/Beta hydrolase protein [Globomyces pollinis-pini]|nr:Alpha/Beta hydrolase protein [Globomyces pollinis-pini]
MIFYILAFSNLVSGIVTGEVSTLKWTQCGDEKNPTLECSSLLVPLDYANPSSKLIEIALNRKPAPVQPAKLSLLFNPGGPGGSGLDLVNGFPSSYYDNEVDYIGFDPRGGGKSQPVACADTAYAMQTFTRDGNIFGVDFVPESATSEQIAVFAAYSELTGQSCLKHSGELLYYVATAYVCRDMDEIRKALGMKKMNYMGFSYGTALGSTYANMFPDNVGRMILDGVVNPNDYYGNVFDFFSGLVDLDATFKSVANACDQATVKECPLSKQGSKDGKTASQTIHSVIESLKSKPLIVNQTSIPAVVTSQIASKVLFRSMYDSTRFFPMIQAFHEASRGNGYPLSQMSPSFNETVLKANAQIGNPGLAILCSDTDISTTKISVDEWSNKVKHYENTVSKLGSREWGWMMLAWYMNLLLIVSRTWPRSPKTEHYKGPWNKKFNFPIMIVGNTFDPVTPLKSAKELYQMMNEGHAGNSNAVLLHHNGHGHCSVGQRSECTRKLQVDYMLRGLLPPKDAVCQPDNPLFGKKIERLAMHQFKFKFFK